MNEMWECPNCGELIEEEWDDCPYCGWSPDVNSGWVGENYG
jgi:RNA polymerase subunit RPABC4/transcription elongation factor Spt4